MPLTLPQLERHLFAAADILHLAAVPGTSPFGASQDLQPIAEEARQRLQAALDALG